MAKHLLPAASGLDDSEDDDPPVLLDFNPHLRDTDKPMTWKKSSAEEIRRLTEQLEEYQRIFGSALVILEDGTMQYGRFLFTVNAMDCPTDMTEAEWLDVGEKLFKIQNALNWYLGDWLAAGWTAGDETWEGKYIALATRFRYKVSSVKSFASVCRKLPPLTRVKGLNFAHHRLVTRFDPDTRKMWLEKALAGDWSAKQLRLEIKKKRGKQTVSQTHNAIRKRMEHIRKWAEQMEDKSAVAAYLREIADKIDET